MECGGEVRIVGLCGQISCRGDEIETWNFFILSCEAKTTNLQRSRLGSESKSIPVVWRRFNHVPSFQVVARRFEPPELFPGVYSSVFQVHRCKVEDRPLELTRKTGNRYKPPPRSVNLDKMHLYATLTCGQSGQKLKHLQVDIS